MRKEAVDGAADYYIDFYNSKKATLTRGRNESSCFL